MSNRKISELPLAEPENLHNAALVHVVDQDMLLAVDRNLKATITQLKGTLLSSPALAADDTTGTSLGLANTNKVIPAGFWMMYASPGVTLQMFINGLWRSSGLDPTMPLFIISDGTNVRLTAPSGDYNVYLRRINPPA